MMHFMQYYHHHHHHHHQIHFGFHSARDNGKAMYVRHSLAGSRHPESGGPDRPVLCPPPPPVSILCVCPPPRVRRLRCGLSTKLPVWLQYHKTRRVNMYHLLVLSCLIFLHLAGCISEKHRGHWGWGWRAWAFSRGIKAPMYAMYLNSRDISGCGSKRLRRPVSCGKI